MFLALMDRLGRAKKNGRSMTDLANAAEVQSRELEAQAEAVIRAIERGRETRIRCRSAAHKCLRGKP